MKRSAILLLFVVFFITGLEFSISDPENPQLCCQQICLVNGGGGPIVGCTVDVYDQTGALVGSCVSGPTGCCQVCGLLPGATYTIKLQCCPVGPPFPFVACGPTVIMHC